MTHFDHNALFSAVKVKVFVPAEYLAGEFPAAAKYSDEYPTGWYLVTHSLIEYILKRCMLNFMLLLFFFLTFPVLFDKVKSMREF